MTALRISISFLISIVLLTSAMLISQAMSHASSLDRNAKQKSAGMQFSKMPADARPCGLLVTTDLPLPAISSTRISTDPVAFESSSPRRPLRARDLPGIVKLEPEFDLNVEEIAKGHCSATRIADDWFVTAAHCVTNGYDRIVLKVGSESLLSENIRSVPVDYAVCHAGFTGENNLYENDLSLLHIADEDLPALEGVPIIAWGRTSQPFDTVSYTAARVGGWGLKTYHGELNERLQKMELDILEIDPKRIKLASRAGRGPCVGDSGGPLMIEDAGKPVLMGVLSTISANRFGEMCVGQYISTYTNLSNYRGWARNAMEVCDAEEDLCREG